MSFDDRQVLVSCEHASNALPAGMAWPDGLGDLHIAWDPGALSIARRLARMFDAVLHAGQYSRLVVDLNRTVGNSRLIRKVSDGHRIPFNRGLDESEVQRRLDEYYLPYRTAVAAGVARIIDEHDRCIHLCIHTYTPRLAGKTRRNDIGLLYDPSRVPESAIVHELRDVLARRTGLVVWLNRPYSGTADGILPRLRERHAGERYVAIELEVNQRFADRPRELAALADAFGDSLRGLSGWSYGSSRSS